MVASTAIVGLLAACATWHMRHRAFEKEKAAFLVRYQAVMEHEIKIFYFTFDQLPETAQEMVGPNCGIRRPWVMTAVVTYGFNRPSLMEGWLAFEKDMFRKIIPICQPFRPIFKK